MNSEQIKGFIRHTLTLVGGIIVAKGIVDEQTMMEGVGLAMSVIGYVWSFYDKKQIEE
jgi:hypothetical protein